MLELISDKTKKESRSVSLLLKFRYYIRKYLLRSIYHSIFNSHLIYACEIWGQIQTNCYFEKLLQLKEKGLRIINFKPQKTPSNCIFKENKILRILGFVNCKYTFFVRKSLRRGNVVIFNDMFIPLNLSHNHNIRANNIPQNSEINMSLKECIYSFKRME